MSGELKLEITKKASELLIPPTWISLIKPLDKDKFPDSAEIERLVRVTDPLNKKLKESLGAMGINEGDQHDVIFGTLVSLWQLRINKQPISNREITLGDIRSLNGYQLSVIDGVGGVGQFGVAITQRLFR